MVDLSCNLRRRGPRQDTRIADRPGWGGPAWRQFDDRHRRIVARRSVSSGRLQYDCASAWHDDRRRQSPAFRIFSRHHPLDRSLVRRPITLLGMVIFSSGVLSAFLVNDTICLVMTPLVLELVTRLKRNPIPYLLAIATASNIGSVANRYAQPSQ
jgi:Citrate transporter